jgi:hypothetical protein
MAIDDIVKEDLFISSKDELLRAKELIEERLEYLNKPLDSTNYEQENEEDEEDEEDEE